jgi:glycosyltransferase involved in cell wall biosynthesis
LTGWHGIPMILDAFRSQNWPTSVDLVFIGDGPEKPIIEKAASENSRIHYIGKKDYKLIPSYIVGALCGLVPMSSPSGRSDTGLYPLKLFETLACGVPVIVTDFPGQADLVRNGKCGIVIKDGDSEALANAVSEIYANPEDRNRMGENGAKLIRDYHTWDARAAQTHDILMTLKPMLKTTEN